MQLARCSAVLAIVLALCNAWRRAASLRVASLRMASGPAKEYGRSRIRKSVSPRPNPWDLAVSQMKASLEKSASIRKTGAAQKASGGSSADDLHCPHFGTCSGCSVSSNFITTPVMVAAKDYFKSKGIEMHIQIGNVSAWRTHAKLAVRPMSKWGGLKVGLFKAGSRELEPIPHCQVHHPRINEAAEAIRIAALDSGVKGFVDPTSTHPSSGELRYLQLSLERATGLVQAVLVWNTPTLKESGQSLSRLSKLLQKRPDLFHSLTVNFNTATTAAIFSSDAKSWRTLWGPSSLEEKIGQVTFLLRPQVFRQANLDMFESSLLPTVTRLVPRDSRVAEMYAGVGILGLNLLASGHASTLLCSDSNPFARDLFDSAVSRLPAEQRERAGYDCQCADDAFAAGQCDQAEVLVVDPPRKGLTSGVLQTLCDPQRLTTEAPALERLVYVSCGFAGLQKDTEELQRSRLWRVASAEGFALFPGSDHVEIVAAFDRVR